LVVSEVIESNQNIRTVVALVAYDGTDYAGMQRQTNQPTIQQALEDSFFKLTKVKSNVLFAGRTDAGVHARGMAIHVRIDDTFRFDETTLTKAWNAHLPNDIHIRTCVILEGSNFHSRFSAIAREYTYSIAKDYDPLYRRYAWYPRYELDEDLLVESARIFLGNHDFTTFSKYNAAVQSYICEVEVCQWTVTEQSYQLKIKANRFVYGMVRSLVGAMVDIARGHRSIDEVSESLQLKNRSLISRIAPAHGLVFEKAHYSPDPFGEMK
jgi:tRNA pseudouridine38-40 synthase